MPAHTLLLLALTAVLASQPQGASNGSPSGIPVKAPPASPATAPVAPADERAAPAPAVQNVDDFPPIEMIPPILDMGVALPKTGMKGSVQLKNTGSKPLKILLTTPSCKCTTVADMTNKVIPVGGFVELEAALEPVSMPQTQKASIRILVEGYGGILELPVRGEVAMPIRANPTLINAVSGRPRNGRVVVESIDKKPFTICAIGGRKPEYIGFDPANDQPQATYLIKYDLDTWSPGPPAYLVVETDRPECPTFDIWVRTEGTIPRPGFRMKDYRVNAGRVDVGGSTEVNVDMEDQGEEIFAVESGSPEVGLKLKGQTSDGHLRRLVLAVTPKNPAGGLFYAPFKIYSNQKEQDLVVFGTARPKGATGCTGCVAVTAPPPTPHVTTAAPETAPPSR